MEIVLCILSFALLILAEIFKMHYLQKNNKPLHTMSHQQDELSFEEGDTLYIILKVRTHCEKCHNQPALPYVPSKTTDGGGLGAGIRRVLCLAITVSV